MCSSFDIICEGPHMLMWINCKGEKAIVSNLVKGNLWFIRYSQEKQNWKFEDRTSLRPLLCFTLFTIDEKGCLNLLWFHKLVPTHFFDFLTELLPFLT